MSKMATNVPENLLAVLGLVTANFRLLETYLNMGIWRLLGAERNQNIGNIVTADLTFSKLINLIGSLHCELCDNPKSVEEFQLLLGEIKNVNRMRNDIIHSIIGAGKDGKAFMLSVKMRSPKGLKMKTFHASKGQLEKVADLISVSAFKLLSHVTDSDFPTFKND